MSRVHSFAVVFNYLMLAYLRIAYLIPYSTKLWREKTLADLAVHGQPAKVLSTKKLSGLVSSNIEWALPLSTAKVFSANILAVPIPPKFSPAKVLCYSVLAYLRLAYLRLIYAQLWRHFLTAILLFLVI